MEQTIRERTQEIERLTLSPYAICSADTRGRRMEEAECAVRTPYQRDRDRIIHCKAFRRLKHKTQVFLAPEGDHYRTRLTHTLEVAQIARTIARGLRLNEDLTEAIALGHDLGHTPFGHAGERALNQAYRFGFHHYVQSLRVVDELEKDGQGLNLTEEVRDGILCHTKGQQAYTLEGQTVRIADRIAYINHDIDDAIRASVLRESDLPAQAAQVLGSSKSSRINTLVLSLLENSGETLQMEPCVQEAFDCLHRFMFEHVYLNPVCKGEEGKAMDMLLRIFDHLAAHPALLPDEYARIRDTQGVERAVCDYIAGMSDRYALSTFHTLFVPRAWEERQL